MLIQPASSQPRLVRDAVVLLEHSTTVQITEQNKWMQRSRHRDSSSHATRFQSFTFQSLCSLDQARCAAQWRALNNFTVVARRLLKPIWRSELYTIRLLTVRLAPSFNWEKVAKVSDLVNENHSKDLETIALNKG
ncbi:hypothetical protein TNCV_4687711 [Trichonephila clavipes]|nr:hypothetical protein TNCV_4687711 [Trichonephila clavipes]